MAEGDVRHWTVEDDGFTDRWEYEGDDGLHGWVDRVVVDGVERFDFHARDVDGRSATRDGAWRAMMGVLYG